MSAPSTSLSSLLDAFLSQPRPRSSSSSASSSSSNGGSRLPLCLNLTHPLSSLSRVHALRSLRGHSQLSFRPVDPYSSFPTFSPSRPSSHLGHPPKRSAFLGPDGLDKLQILDGFRYAHELPHGSLEVRVMALAELRTTIELLAASFSDALWIPARYVRVLEFLVEQYVVQKRAQRPHAATLVVYYRERDAAEAHFAGTVEVSFNAMGGNVSPPSPVPPTDAPYICNMTVKETLRRYAILPLFLFAALLFSLIGAVAICCLLVLLFP